MTKPRLRRKGPNGGEVEVPAYAALRQRSDLGNRILQILMRGVSTRNYEAVVPAMADTGGVSKSSISREVIAASAETLRELTERRFDEVDILIIYIDGLGVWRSLRVWHRSDREETCFGPERRRQRERGLWLRVYWKIWSLEAWRRGSVGCLSSMDRKRCGKRLTACTAKIIPYNADFGIKCGM